MLNNYGYEKMAILVDGGFYRRRAFNLFGDKTPKERANELVTYCMQHIKDYNNDTRYNPTSLYRIFYYDCPPMEGNIHHPLKDKPIDMKRTQNYKWSYDFMTELANKRRVALRMGELQEKESGYRIRSSSLNKLIRKEISVDDLTDLDFEPDFVQKGVDMRIGLDIASLAYKKQVSQIVLIAGDSDFVPVAKHARREGIDFILDPMWQSIRPGLNEHIDGLKSCTSKCPAKTKDPLCNEAKIREYETIRDKRMNAIREGIKECSARGLDCTIDNLISYFSYDEDELVNSKIVRNWIKAYEYKNFPISLKKNDDGEYVVCDSGESFSWR